jgi:hypothetical protein
MNNLGIRRSLWLGRVLLLPFVDVADAARDSSHVSQRFAIDIRRIPGPVAADYESFRRMFARGSWS